MKTVISVFVVLLLSHIAAQAATTDPVAEITSPQAAVTSSPEISAEWKQAFAESAPLNIEWAAASSQFEGITIRRLHFTSTVIDGKPQRIYAIYASPVTTPTADSAKVPAILQIHGGGQTCYPQNLNWFVKHGYACISFDWSGPRKERPEDQVTHWLPGVSRSLTDQPTTASSRAILFQCVLASRAAISVLEQQPEIDKTRIGVQGVSWGGQLAWLVAGVDPRVKAVVPVYGAGGEDIEWNSMGEGLRREKPEWVRKWTELFDPRSLAPHITAPVLFLSGSNDYFGRLHTAEYDLSLVHTPHWRSYGANRMHSLNPGSVRAAMRWFDYQLKKDGSFPQEPKLQLLTNDQYEVVARVTAPDTTEPLSVHVDLARGYEEDLLKCWISHPAKRVSAGVYETTLPLLSGTMPIAAIAQVNYSPGFLLSSPVQRAIPVRDLVGPKSLGPIAQDVVQHSVYSWNQDPSGWYINRGVDFPHSLSPDAELTTAILVDRIGVTFTGTAPIPEFTVSTRLTADPARERGDRHLIEIWTFDVESAKVRLNYLLRKPNDREYEAEITPGQGWQCTTLQLQDFKFFEEETSKTDATQPSPQTWNDVHQITIFGKTTPAGRPAVGAVGWTGAPH